MTTLRVSMENRPSIERIEAKHSPVKSDVALELPALLNIDEESDEPSTSSQSRTTSNRELGPSALLDPKIAYKLKPFNMEWCFGFDFDVPIVNLTVEDKIEILYVCNNNVIIYNYTEHKMKFLQAHQNKICTVSADMEGHFVATADKGEDHCILVWDTVRQMPVYTIFYPYPDSGVHLVGMSPSGRYIISVGESTDFIVDFWRWTTGDVTPADSTRVRNSRGLPRKIVFNPDKEEHVMIIFDSGIALLVWDPEKRKIQDVTFPNHRNKAKVGSLTDGTYVKSCHECFVTTDKGYILKFGSNLYSREFEERELDNNKIYINSAKLSQGSMTCITSIDDKLVLGDSLGNLAFYDKRLKVIYWQTHLSLTSIKCISISTCSRKLFTPLLEASSRLFSGSLPRITKSLDSIKAENSELDSNAKDCIVSTEDGNLYIIDALNDKSENLFFKVDGYVACIETHTQKPYLIIAYDSGCLYLIDYLEKRVVSSSMLPEPLKEEGDNYDETEKTVVSAIKYCSKSLHLVCGRSNGELWVLEPILLTPREKECFQISSSKIIKIAFSVDSLQFAYYDSRNTTYLFNYDSDMEAWTYVARMRAHYKDVTDIMFYPGIPSTLFTLGADRNIVTYKNWEARENNVEFEAIRYRIEQSAIPNNMMWYPLYDPATATGFILIADNQYKYKLFNDTTLIPHSTVLAPAYGCYKNNPVRKMMLIPETKGEYMVYMSLKHLGIQKLPADGNPYKYVGMAAHPEKLHDFALSFDGTYAFSFGNEDRAVVMWSIKTGSVDDMEKIGGTGIEPFYCLLEGGKNGWLFHEMQDLFYYMQVLNMGETTVLPRKVSDAIPISELPDLVRACGYYPSDFEIEGMMIDIKNRDYLETGVFREEISFLEFVKLYINHRPAYGYLMEELENAFDTYVMSVEDPSYGSITKESFIDTMVRRGEAFNEENLFKCLAILMGEDQEQTEVNFDFLPDDIDCNTLIDDILGIDLERREIECEETEVD